MPSVVKGEGLRSGEVRRLRYVTEGVPTLAPLGPRPGEGMRSGEVRRLRYVRERLPVLTPPGPGNEAAWMSWDTVEDLRSGR